MEIPDTWASLLVSAIKDAVSYNQQLLKSETLRNRDEYEEHLVILSEFFEYVKEEYKNKVQDKGGIPLEKLL
ncbi:MAG: hypothetical protein RL701_5665 [Pseudomonadota bacterium]|jgi:hypothetical protein